MNWFATNGTTQQFVDSLRTGERLVLYPLRVPKTDPPTTYGWGNGYETLGPLRDEHDVLRGDSAIFVKVQNVELIPDPDCLSYWVWITNRFPKAGESNVMYLHLTYWPARNLWDYQLECENYNTPGDLSELIELRQSIIGVLRCNEMCANIVAASRYRAERVMMSEVLAAKMGDAAAISVISRAFYPPGANLSAVMSV